MPDRFIVSPLNGEKFITKKQVGDKTLIINTSIENAKDVNRIGVVVSLPLNYEGNIVIGDNVVVQHNVFRTYFDGAGLTRESDFHIKEDLFQVSPDLIFLIIRGNEKIAVDGFAFIAPIVEEKKWIGEVEKEHIGIVKYTNSDLLSVGVKQGSTIAFLTDSEYEFTIDGERLYRMRTNCILAEL
jgi:hypothetical protein